MADSKKHRFRTGPMPEPQGTEVLAWFAETGASRPDLMLALACFLILLCAFISLHPEPIVRAFQ